MATCPIRRLRRRWLFKPNHSTTMKLKIEKLHPAAIIPTYGTLGAGCFDLYACNDGAPHPTDPHAAIYDTGLAFEVPAGWIMEIDSRSGHGFKDAIRLSNCSGQIDSDYRGEVKVSLRFDGDPKLRCTKIRSGDRIAQAKLVPAPRVEFEVVDELSTTARGTGGFGSTGTGALSPASEASFMERCAPGFTRETNGLPTSGPRKISDREWAALPSNLREGCTVHVPGVGDL